MSIHSNTCILIPTLNEEQTIGPVIDGFTSEGFENILVVDGGSTDNTQEIARGRGARVVTQSGSGKGQAVREAQDHINSEYFLMVDGDQTYRPEDAERMLEPLHTGEADHVIGNRFAKMQPGAMTRLNKFGNKLINRAFRMAHSHNFQDILSGYRAFRTDTFDQLYLESDGFGIETEIAVEATHNNIRTVIVPIYYDSRPEGSETNLSPISHGSRIIATLYSLAKINNPLFYFGVLGGLASLIGICFGSYVGFDWFIAGKVHHVLSLVSAFFLLLGSQLLVFGVLADLMLSYHKRLIREIKRNEH